VVALEKKKKKTLGYGGHTYALSLYHESLNLSETFLCCVQQLML